MKVTQYSLSEMINPDKIALYRRYFTESFDIIFKDKYYLSRYINNRNSLQIKKKRKCYI